MTMLNYNARRKTRKEIEAIEHEFKLLFPHGTSCIIEDENGFKLEMSRAAGEAPAKRLSTR